MHDLDSRDFVLRHDPKGMFGLFEAVPDQCRRARKIAEEAEIAPLRDRPNVVGLTGLGGSAAGGDFARALFEAQGAVPFFVNRDYHLPHFVGLGDVVFCASYSGDTEETLSAYADAKRAGARIIAVTSGGQLGEMAKGDGQTVITVPGGQPPRSALGFMLIPMLVACVRLKLLPSIPFDQVFDGMERTIRSIAVEVEVEGNRAKKLAQAIHGGIPVIYGLGSWQAVVANRWKGQINENAKNLCFTNVYPELNHNEVLGWIGAPEQGARKWVGIRLEDGTESAKMKARASVTEGLISSAVDFHTVAGQGESLLEKMLSLASYGDFVSLYLAALNAVDPETIEYIDRLKAELAKV